MATNKPKVQGYIDPQIFDRYTQFKNEHGITKDSEALNKILASFLGFDSTPKTDLVSRIEFETAIADLRSEFLGNKPETKIESSIASEDTKIRRENIPFPRATSTEEKPIRVKRSLIENQGEYIFDDPEKNKSHEFHEYVKAHGISTRDIAQILGVPQNTLNHIKGRIQDYIKEKHPDKPIYVKVKLIGYGKKGDDIVKFFPQNIAWTLLGISEETTEPWEPKIRRAVLSGSAIIEG
jgi:hypothetical protein